MKKLLSVFLVFATTATIVFSTLAVDASAVLGDGSQLSVKIELEAGTMSGSVFTKLPAGKILHKDDIITVRISPESDFLCGATRYVVMYNNAYFQITTAGKNAFTPNTANTFYASVADGWAGATGVPADPIGGIPQSAWPPEMVTAGIYAAYDAVCVNNGANSNAPNGGFPGYLPGEWLFSFNLKVLKDITAGTDARIWMDSRFLKTPDYTSGAMYFSKCTSSTQLSSSGSNSIYYFDIDLSGADMNLDPAATAALSITRNATELDDILKIQVPWYGFYRDISTQLGFQTNITGYARAEWSSNSKKVLVDQTGKITNTKIGARSALITVKLYDVNNFVIATDTLKVIFYKYSYQLKNL
jgi:hypothetical protein